MASDEAVALLDHIIVLLPHDELLNPPKWISENFNITDGGKHADGKTENKLIVFQDGTYIELISFINDLPENRAGHWWGAKPYSIIDWAFTTTTDYSLNHETVVSRLSGLQQKSPAPGRRGWFSYAPPQMGGRIRPDGVRLEWAVTFPTYTEKDGSPTRPPNIPFFCHDITPREHRVNGLTDHPCGATGIREVQVLTDEADLKEYATYISTVVNSNQSADLGRIAVGTPSGTNGGVIFVSPTTDEERSQVKQRAFILKRLAFHLPSGDDPNKVTFSYPN
ncbi:hypothetical protein H072_5064 [Dactylellina haptotyla CBS 200.50]|uniref:Glyoxalase-like domain-containing protein n=1 Tax=Dactylellina haptotyla (strain CBS 200.50) TaxID=1284197 RepID=S8ADF7_DACHA|nr:hypothetical protein H072_5064 [Dactylellina haptotyla CBS 200.50]